jgi:hypothetical protein
MNDRKVQLVDGELGIAHRQILGEHFAPDDTTVGACPIKTLRE